MNTYEIAISKSLHQIICSLCHLEDNKNCSYFYLKVLGHADWIGRSDPECVGGFRYCEKITAITSCTIFHIEGLYQNTVTKLSVN